MDDEVQLLAKDFKVKINQIVEDIGQHLGKFDTLMQLFYSNHKRLIQRTSNVIEVIYQKTT
jgi:hypothetical protein